MTIENVRGECQDTFQTRVDNGELSVGVTYMVRVDATDSGMSFRYLGFDVDTKIISPDVGNKLELLDTVDGNDLHSQIGHYSAPYWHNKFFISIITTWKYKIYQQVQLTLIERFKWLILGLAWKA